MKIEFVKESKADGSVFYFTQVDGRFVDKTLAFKFEDAKQIYDNVVAHKGKYTTTEILDTVEIVDYEEAQS